MGDNRVDLVNRFYKLQEDILEAILEEKSTSELEVLKEELEVLKEELDNLTKELKDISKQ